MKKYTLEQLKTEKIKISVKTEQISSALMKKFEEHNISWCGGEKATSYKAFGENTLVNLCDAKGHITFGVCADDYTIITPDQIDWGEEMKKYTDYLMDAVKLAQQNMDKKIAELSKHKQDKTPAVFIKAQKDWNGFKAFLKEVEAHGRTLTGSQLKAYMAKERKLRESK